MAKLEDYKDEYEEKKNGLRMAQALSRSPIHVLSGHIMGLRHVYGGTVPEATIKKRRNKNKVARKSRRQNRGK